MGYILLFIVLLISDQWTKNWAIQMLKGSAPKSVIPDFLSFTYVENRGAAFGILQDQRWFFILVTLLVVSLVTGYFILNYNKLSFVTKTALILINIGAIGNFMDRLRLGFVVDFISVKLFGRWDFPVFNVADICVVVGAILLFIALLFTKDFDTTG